MEIVKHLINLKDRGLIDDNTEKIVLRIKQRLADYWTADVTTPKATMVLFHFACALGRVQRSCTIPPLYQEFLDEIKNSDSFYYISMIHNDLIRLIPFNVPLNEQTYFFANISFLLSEQPCITENIHRSFRLTA